MSEPYRIEKNEDGSCDHCMRTLWDVVGPDGAALGVSYYEMDDAENMATMLNNAHNLALERPKGSGDAFAALDSMLHHLPELWGDQVVDGQITLKVDASAIDAALTALGGDAMPPEHTPTANTVRED